MEKNELLRGIIEQSHLIPQEIIENFVDQKLVDDKFLKEMAEKAKGFESVNLRSPYLNILRFIWGYCFLKMV